MTAPNHVIGSVAFTGLFASLWSVNILANPYYLIWVCFTSLLPDVDHPKSVIGRIPLVHFFSRWLSNNYGHRTITHSAVCWLAVTVLSSFVEKLFFDSSMFTFLLSFSYLSHLIFDMMTKQGVMFFYPFIKNPCVVPARPELRFRTGDFRQETMFFCVSACMLVFMYPLMETGFWTSYNRTFSTTKHVNSEYRKNEGLVLVDYEIKKEGQTFKGSGLVVGSSDNQQILLEDDKFTIIDNNQMIVRKTYPTPTNKQMKIKKHRFVNIDYDSLVKILKPPFYKIEISSSLTANYNNEFKSNFKGELVNDLFVVPPTLEATEIFIANPRIESLENEIINIRKSYQSEIEEFSKVETRIKELEQNVLIADYSEREFIQTELNELRKVKQPLSQDDKIQSLSMKIEELKQADILKKSQIKRPEPCLFTGFIEKVIIY